MIYLDNAATSYPKPEAVYARADYVLRNVGGNPGRGSHKMALDAMREVFKAREAVARLLGIKDSSRLVFTKNATEAINAAIKGVMSGGGHVITSSFEHNAVLKTLLSMKKRGVITLTEAAGKRPGFLDASDIEALITDETELVVITHASNVFGEILPVEEIAKACKEHGVIFMTDAAQTAGAIPMDLSGSSIDILAATGHKALFGPQGTGILYLRDGIEIEPFIDGSTGAETTVLNMPEKLEAGTVNTPGIAALGAGAAFIMQEGVTGIRKKEERFVGIILKELASIKGIRILGPMDAAKRASLVCFTIDGITANDAGVVLDREFSIMVRCGTHCAPAAHRVAGTFPEGAIRVSPGYFNTDADIEAFLKAVKAVAAKG
ncbi:MAG: aminotransferase class V-fold PLP-dependent enzyme [Deltaproteobacteria bacterium]|nr:aminotransferase class V-fold PLP-dependent enzyme [Deltaproteobacteria bacterium]